MTWICREYKFDNFTWVVSLSVHLPEHSNEVEGTNTGTTWKRKKEQIKNRCWGIFRHIKIDEKREILHKLPPIFLYQGYIHLTRKPTLDLLIPWSVHLLVDFQIVT